MSWELFGIVMVVLIILGGFAVIGNIIGREGTK
jgi:hypothetical protein